MLTLSQQCQIRLPDSVLTATGVHHLNHVWLSCGRKKFCDGLQQTLWGVTTVTALINWSCLGNVGHFPPIQMGLSCLVWLSINQLSQQRCLKNEPQPHNECAPILLTNGGLQDLLWCSSCGSLSTTSLASAMTEMTALLLFRVCSCCFVLAINFFTGIDPICCDRCCSFSQWSFCKLQGKTNCSNGSFLDWHWQNNKSGCKETNWSSKLHSQLACDTAHAKCDSNTLLLTN